MEGTTGNVTLTVTTGGSDTPTLSRPARLLSGDYSAAPFLTIQAAIDSLPLGFHHTVKIDIGAGNFVGATVRGKHGRELIIKGTIALASLTTGVNAGTAGAGTTGTALKKPGAAANWTSGEIRGKRAFVLLTGGAGFVANDYGKNFIPILDNTVDTLVLPPENAALDSSTTFQIVVMDTKLVTMATATQPFTGKSYMMGIFNCTADVHSVAIGYEHVAADYNILTQNTMNAYFRGCHIKAGTSKMYSGNAAMDCCVVSNAAIIKPTVERFSFLRNALSVASLWTYRSQIVDAEVDLDADCGTLNGVIIENAVSAIISGAIRNCASGTPYLLKSVLQSVSLVSGANAGTARGIEVSKGGQHIITGSDIAGAWANQVLVEGHPTSYTFIAARGAMMDRGTFVHWGAGGMEILNKLSIKPVISDVIGGTQTLSPGSAFITEGESVISNAEKNYGIEFNLNYAEITAGTTQTQAGATLVGFRDTVVTVGNTNDGARLLSLSDIGQVGGVGGMKGRVWNDTLNALKLYPPTGKKIYLDGVDQGTNTSVAFPAGADADWILTASSDYRVRIT
jgi:hypothetical protein